MSRKAQKGYSIFHLRSSSSFQSPNLWLGLERAEMESKFVDK